MYSGWDADDRDMANAGFNKQISGWVRSKSWLWSEVHPENQWRNEFVWRFRQWTKEDVHPSSDTDKLNSGRFLLLSNVEYD